MTSPSEAGVSRPFACTEEIQPYEGDVASSHQESLRSPRIPVESNPGCKYKPAGTSLAELPCLNPVLSSLLRISVPTVNIMYLITLESSRITHESGVA
jgi:hypothetical protein